jgi:hypothetical protein
MSPERANFFNSAPLVHGPVAFGGLLERQGQVKDLAGLDLSVPDQVDELRVEVVAGRLDGDAVDAVLHAAAIVCSGAEPGPLG